ncbi:MAG: gliding motility-associated C-terminal domain-containing protein [Prevotellaceae bacterium]|jgi:gliding motility-associated-like protein|nr:gliding motility-associated C-terminal domain-containing protein [Prevotellaceae bacterium]
MNIRITTLLLILPALLQGQTSSKGTEFRLTFGRNMNQPSGNVALQIRVVAAEAATITGSYPANSALNFTVAVAAGSVYTRNLSGDERAAVYAWETGLTNRSLRIQTTAPVSVFAINQRPASTDATNVLPVAVLGMEYYHVSYHANVHYDGYAIVATADGTQIYVNSAPVALLNTGEVYANYHSAASDKTGLHVRADKPVAYFAVNPCANVPTNAGACDCLYQQMAPVDVWGKRFLTPVTRRALDRLRIVAAYDSTHVVQTGGVLISGALTLNRGQFAELEINTASGGCYLEADKPIAVGAYITGAWYFNSPLMNIGDPSMAWVPPVEQMTPSVVIAPFIPSGTTELTEHHALIITPTATRDMTTMAAGNGMPAALAGGVWTTGANAAYSFYSLPLSDTNQTYFIANPGGMTVMGYGMGAAESYYYLADAAFRTLNAAFDIDSIHYQDMEGRTVCDGAFTITAVLEFTPNPAPGSLRWFIDGVENTAARDSLLWHIVLPAGEHTIEMQVIDSQNETYIRHTTFTVAALPTVAVAAGGPPFYSGESYTLSVQTPDGDLSYYWYKDGEATGITGVVYLLPSLHDDDAGVYTVEAVSAQGCRTWSAPLAVALSERFGFFIPNIFTPNGDGVNDNFYISGLDSYSRNELTILNKRGRTAFSAVDYHNEWYGDNQPDDIYYYRLRLYDSLGTETLHEGYVHIKR